MQVDKTPVLLAPLWATLLAASVGSQVDWQRLTPASAPSARVSHAMAYDAGRDRLVITGGYDGARDLDEVWEFDGSVWLRRTFAGGPGIHSSHALAYDPTRGVVVMFGGWDGAGGGLDATWEWDGAAGTWTRRTPANRPPGRYSHRLTFDPTTGRVVLFGGQCSSACGLADTWEWDGAAGTWTPRTPVQSPSPRWSFGMTFDERRGRVVVYGGGVAGGQADDLWEWDGTAGTWTQLQFSAPSPGRRSTHSLTWDAHRRCAVLFGGFNGSTWGRDTWEWDGSAWHQRQPASSPGNRGFVTTAYDPVRRRTVLFGGWTGSVPLGDTWVYATASPARYVAFGAACSGTVGAPRLIAETLPWIGAQLQLRVDGAPPAAMAAAFVGGSNVVWGNVPLPFDLGTIGMSGCQLLVSGEVAVPLPAPSGGVLQWGFHVRNDPALVGRVAYLQVFLTDAGANPLGVIATEGGEAVIGAR